MQDLVLKGKSLMQSLELPPYFPLKTKKCAAVADHFFSCFEKESLPNGDVKVGSKALETCQEQLEAYKTCMDKFTTPKWH